MAPPLRTDDDRDALFEYLERGTLDIVSTDHVAFTREAKSSETWWDAGFGVNGLQRSLPVFHDEAVVRRGYSYPFLVRTMSTRPAQTFGLESKGRIAPGYDADIVVFDPEKTQTISARENASLADYSIYEGRELTGAVETTLVRGEVVAQDDEIVGDHGHGVYATRGLPDWDA
jgi:dihydropyrimidinase